jgi:hypothetical protein
MSHTTVASLGTDFATNLDGREPDTVFFAAERWVGVGSTGAWDTVALDEPFEYNGFDNLLVDVTWNGTECGDEDAVVLYGFSLDGTHRRAWEFDWQATTAQRSDNCEFNTLFGFADAGVEDKAEGGVLKAEAAAPTVVRGVLSLRPVVAGSRQELLDATGQTVMRLAPGANDVSRLNPGVYFIAPGDTVPARRVVILR